MDSGRSTLSTADLQAITDLRTALIETIKAGDAAKYASLCTEDVQLLHPNAPLVTGRAELQAHNAAINQQMQLAGAHVFKGSRSFVRQRRTGYVLDRLAGECVAGS